MHHQVCGVRNKIDGETYISSNLKKKEKVKKEMKNLMIVFYFLSIMNISATTINIPEDYPSINIGLIFAVDGDIILVQPGTYVENINYNGKNITIASLFLTTQDTTYISQTIIDGNQEGCVVTFESGEDSTAVLTGFTITNGLNIGSINESGGGIACMNSSNPSLDNLIISNNSVESMFGSGGGIFCYSSSPKIKNVKVVNNSADHQGGGIHCRWMSNPKIENVTIKNNSARDGGGIACSASSNPYLEHVNITNNSAIDNTNARGGGIYCSSSNLILDNVTIVNNTSDNYGGGIYCDSSNPIFSNENRSNIHSNTIAGYRGIGSDIYSFDCPSIDVIVDTFTIINPSDYYASPIDIYSFDILNGMEGSLIDADLFVAVDGDDSNSGTSINEPYQTINHAIRMIYSDSLNINTIHLAEGVYSQSTNGEIFPIQWWSSYINIMGSSEDLTVLDAESSGTVIEIVNVTETLLKDVTITGGSANKGGGLYCSSSTLNLENVSILNNSASYQGGGIYSNGSSLILENVNIMDNFASTYGGGIYLIYCELIMSSNQLFDNYCSDGAEEGRGGAIYMYESTLNLSECDILNNSANSHAGAIYMSRASADIDKCTFVDNTSGGNVGGLYYYISDSLDITNCTFYNNTGSDSGAIRFYLGNAPNNPPIIQNTICWNNSPAEILCSADGQPIELIVGYSDIEGGLDAIVTNNNANIIWLEGNINENPLFADSLNGDFHLTFSSPCIDTGDPNSPLDPDGTNADMGAFYYDQPSDIVENVIQNTSVSLNNFPNPFNPTTTISFSIQEESKIDLSIYNIKGQKIKSLLSDQIFAGDHSIAWNGEDTFGEKVGSGVYLYKLNVNGKTEAVKKCLLLK